MKDIFYKINLVFLMMYVVSLVLKSLNLISSPVFLILNISSIILGMLCLSISNKKSYLAYLYILFFILLFVSFRNS